MYRNLKDTGKNTLSRTNFPHSDKNLLESKEFVALIMTDMRVLLEIVRGNPKKLSELYE